MHRTDRRGNGINLLHHAAAGMALLVTALMAPCATAQQGIDAAHVNQLEKNLGKARQSVRHLLSRLDALHSTLGERDSADTGIGVPGHPTRAQACKIRGPKRDTAG